MRTDDYALSFTKTYIDLKLNPCDTTQRISFLSLLTICFLNQINKNKHYGFIDEILKYKTFDETFLEVFEFNRKEQNIASQAIQLEITGKLGGALEGILQIIKDFDLESSSRNQFITIYEQTLKRLLEPSKKNREAKNFDYELRPDDFSRFISAIATGDNLRAYDALASTGEISNYLASKNPHWHYTIESVVQNPQYLMHKSVLAGTDDPFIFPTYALSPEPHITQGTFDLSYSLFEPRVISKSDSNKSKFIPLKKTFDPNRIKRELIPSKYLEHALIQHLIWSIKPDGMAIAFIGKGPLQRQGEKEARQFLLENNYIDAVIQLPPSLISAKTVDLYALIFKKNRTKGDVLFVNASEFYERDTKRNRLINEHEIATIIENRQDVIGISKSVSVEHIIFNECMLNVTSYVKPIKPKSIGESIGELSQELFDQQTITDELLKKLNKVINL
jgi:type I restriction-modification system DNA methylase subunit